jgi:hypothetical protein
MRLLREPFVHFTALGAVVFLLWGLANPGKDQPVEVGGAAAGGAVAAVAVSRTVTVGAADVQALRATFRAASKREPTAGELADLVRVFISEEILFREGVAQGLDRGDRVVRRRVIEKMTAVARPTAPVSDPPREELRRWYETYKHRFVRPATVTFDQIFFDPQRRARAWGEAERALASLGAGRRVGAGAAVELGDKTVVPAHMAARSRLELAHLLGESFATAVLAAPVARWHGPIESRYGVHLVRVVEHQAQHTPTFEEAEKHVRADWLTVETRGLRAAGETLLPRYRIELPRDLRRELAGEPGLAPYLRRAP